VATCKRCVYYILRLLARKGPASPARLRKCLPPHPPPLRDFPPYQGHTPPSTGVSPVRVNKLLYCSQPRSPGPLGLKHTNLCSCRVGHMSQPPPRAPLTSPFLSADGGPKFPNPALSTLNSGRCENRQPTPLSRKLKGGA
jgi:hypothetical protein